MSNRPTAAQVAHLQAQVKPALKILQDNCSPVSDATRDAAVVLTAFCDVALYVMARTNPGKIRDAALSVQIKHYLEGPPA